LSKADANTKQQPSPPPDFCSGEFRRRVEVLEVDC
jgi:hypothetical protein